LLVGSEEKLLGRLLDSNPDFEAAEFLRDIRGNTWKVDWTKAATREYYGSGVYQQFVTIVLNVYVNAAVRASMYPRDLSVVLKTVGLGAECVN
jgi:hypothetical protein